MPQENATFWLGTENMDMEALHGEGKITRILPVLPTGTHPLPASLQPREGQEKTTALFARLNESKG